MRTPMLGVAALLALVSAAPAEEPTLVERLLTDSGPPLTTYRARRTLRASNARFKARGSLQAMTALENGAFQYEILEEEGSGSVRHRVLRKVLTDEQALWQRGDTARNAITPANYAFEELGPLEDDFGIKLTPLRRDMLLVEGRLLVDPDSGDLRRIEGRLSKNPSFWTNRVEVVRTYARINGVRVPIATQSTAYLKLAGRSEFEMTYEYESINGRPVITAP